MESVGKFLAMGGYAAYVWPAFGLTAAVMIVLFWHAFRSLRRQERAVSQMETQVRDLSGAGAVSGEGEGSDDQT